MVVKSLSPGEEELELPAYTLPEGAAYVDMPVTTLRAWVRGISYPTERGLRRSDAILVLPEPGTPLLSFTNLIEAFVLNSIRKRYGISLQKVRKALRNLPHVRSSKHPLAEEEFRTDGIDLFVEHYGTYIAISRDLQMQMKDLIGTYLQRVEYDEHGHPIRLYPLTRPQDPKVVVVENPRLIMIDPCVAFGKPALSGTGITTGVVADRFLAGDEPKDIAHDYNRPIAEINEAIRWELRCRDEAA